MPNPSTNSPPSSATTSSPRNCVTELLASLEEALAGEAATAGFARARRRDPEAPFAFVPVVAGRVVARQLAISGANRLPSVRERLMARDPVPAWRRWRELGPLTSRTYRPHSADSPFLLFTTGSWATRPLAGAINLSASLVAGVGGLGALPFDRGRLLGRATQGVVMSVPELFFFNVRKGSYSVTPPIEVLDALAAADGRERPL